MTAADGRRHDESGEVAGLPLHPERDRPATRPGPWTKGLARHDLEAYFVFGMALTVGLLGLLDVTDSATVSAATLAVLGLIVFDMLISRRHLRQVETGLRRLADSVRTGEGADSADRLLAYAEPGSALNLAEAADIRLVGVTLSRTIRSHLHLLERRLAAGSTVRVAIIDPSGPEPGEAARRNGLAADLGVFEHRIQPTIDLLRYLSTGAAGQLEVRLLPFVPAFGLVMVDPERPSGHVTVDIYSHRPDGREAVLTLRAGRDPLWYQHFVKEFDRIWAQGRPVPVDRIAD